MQEGNAIDFLREPAKGQGKNRVIHEGRDNRRHDGLRVDSEEAVNLPPDEGVEANRVQAFDSFGGGKLIVHGIFCTMGVVNSIMGRDTIENVPQRSSPDARGKSRSKAKRLPKKITEDYLHNSGLFYLQKFAASKAHFTRVMSRKITTSCRAHPDQDLAHCMALLERVVNKFERAGLLNDALYSEGAVASLRRRGASARGIAQKLAHKGLSHLLIREKLDAHDARQMDGTIEDAELAAALTLARRKKIGPFAKTQDEKTQQKFFAAMARAGFSYQTARKILGRAGEDEPLF